METAPPIFLLNLVAVMAMMLLVWLLSLLKRDASVVDIFWGLGFALVAWLTFFSAGGYPGRRLLVTSLVTVWGLRLSIHIFLRSRGKGEDRRYQAWRARYGRSYWWVSLFTVFGLQALLLWVISLAIQVPQISKAPQELVLLDGLGTLLWAVGLFFEAAGDWQLSRFKVDPANQGKVMDRGLWAYSRHPNYFGDSLAWWGLYVIALATPGSVWVIISPVLITFLLLKVSGVTLLEKTLRGTRPGYDDYVRRTSGFVPWFPRKNGS